MDRLSPARIHLTDHKSALVFDARHGLRDADVADDDCDIALASDALMNCFSQAWGGETLAVNGRFQVPKNGRYRNFNLYAYIGSLNNRGETYPLDWLRKGLKRKATVLLGKLRRG